jgi:hypothetical protein
LSHSSSPLIRLVWRSRAHDTALVILRHDAARIVIDCQLRELPDLDQAGRVKPPVQAAVGTATLYNAGGHSSGSLGVHVNTKRQGDRDLSILYRWS